MAAMGAMNAYGPSHTMPVPHPRDPAMPLSLTDNNGWKYELIVVQQPQRARMCGFGDKDRRPITPPPCVRLVITDVKTGKECDVNDIDHSMFVLNVDLWSADQKNEVNLVRHSQTSPQVQNTSPVSYGGEHQGAPAYTNILPGHTAMPRDINVKFEHGGGPSYSTPFNQYNQPPQFQQQQQPAYGGVSQYHTYPSVPTSGAQPYSAYPHTPVSGPPYHPQNGYSQPHVIPVILATGAQIHASSGLDYHSTQPYSMPPSAPLNRPYPQPQMPPAGNSQPGGMFTRNLIGSLAASAFRLTDPDDRIGIWFVLQDLSVRTEGTFRLRCSFVNVGRPSPTGSSGSVNTGKAPVLAICFSETFTVYSAKRFPGVVESTDLSKCFATQGIKIPIRKDGQGPGARADRDVEYGDD